MALNLPPAASRLVLGDVQGVLRQEPAESVHLVVSDPPYGLGVAPWDREPDYGQWISEAHRVLRPGGLAYVFGTPEILAEHWTKFPKPRRLLVWHYRNKSSPGAGFWARSYDGIACFWKGKPRFFPDDIREPYSTTYARMLGKRRAATPGRYGAAETVFRDHGGAFPRDVLTGPALAGGAGRREATGHPTQKPAWLMRKLILSATRPGDTVADIFAGSCTASVTALELGRRFLAIEREAAYVEAAWNRLWVMGGGRALA